MNPGTAIGPITDQELLKGIRAGEHYAFELLFRTHYADLLRFARAQVTNPAEAEDIVHDVFLHLWETRAKIGGDRALRTYLLAAVRNRSIDHLRRRALQARWVLPARTANSSGTQVFEWDAPPRDTESDPGELDELARAIESAVANLPERCRTAFLLCRDHDLTYAQAAEAMGVTPATIKTQVARALCVLRQALAPLLSLLISICIASSVFGTW